MARPKGGETGKIGVPPAVGAGCHGKRAAALRTPSMQRSHMECSGPHTLGTEFIRNVIEESTKVWYAHAKARARLLKARLGPSSTMA